MRKIRIPMASLEESHNPKRVEEDRGYVVVSVSYGIFPYYHTKAFKFAIVVVHAFSSFNCVYRRFIPFILLIPRENERRAPS